MVVLSPPPLENCPLIKTCRPATGIFTGIPVISLSDPEAKTLIVKACQEFGFFKLINHGISLKLAAVLESEAIKFFNLPQSEKDRAGPSDPFGYGNKKIGPNGDVGWIEYLLLNTSSPDIDSQKPLSVFPANRDIFRSALRDYIAAIKQLSFEVLELIAEGLEIKERNVFSKFLKDEKSDSCFRLNHYPPWTIDRAAMYGRKGKKI